MTTSQVFIRFVANLFKPLGDFSTKRMLGCIAFIYQDRMVALIIKDDRLYVRVDDQTRAIFAEESCKPFKYARMGRNDTRKEVELSYYSVPAIAFDDRDDAFKWARLGLEAMLRH